MKKFDASDIANWFLAKIDRHAGDALTHLKLHKLVYYAQVWALSLLDQSLFEEDFEAWTHGPALPALHQKYNDYGCEALPPPDSIPVLSENVQDLLHEILEVYGNLSAKYLEELVQSESPWIDARNNLPPEIRSNNIISKESMTDYYKELYQRLNNGQETQENITKGRSTSKAG
ncbi:MAG: DUF4065 domain-containing protein [Desulfobacteraceae bacterium]|nr:DUF4065 domain-containing protein [Desulfobacteraceae bacterium]